MYTITKEFDFSAAHSLCQLPKDHKCYRLHGHNYIVIVELEAEELDYRGFVSDYGELRSIKTWIDTHLDHQNLNEILPFEPTAELIAEKLYNTFLQMYPQLVSVTVKETPKTSATYRKERS